MRRIAWLCAGVLVLASVGLAQENASKSCVGSWKLNTAKSEFGKMPPPKNASLRVTKCSTDEIAYTYSDISADGKTYKDSWSGKPDGQMRPAKTAPPMDMKASFQWQGDTLIANFDMGKDGTAQEQITFGDDGKTMMVKRTFQGETYSQTWEKVHRNAVKKAAQAAEAGK